MLTMRLLASLLRTWHLLVPANTDWFVVNILCHSRGTYLHGDCCFSDLVLYNSKSTLIIKRQRILIVPLVYSNSSIYNIAENLLIRLQIPSQIIIHALILLVVMAPPKSVENTNSYWHLSSLSESF